MTIRTTQTTVRFASPFLLSGFEAPQPAGEYRVDHDEAQIEAGSRLAWQRVGSFIHLPAVGVRSMLRQMVPITAADLEAALEKDRT